MTLVVEDLAVETPPAWTQDTINTNPNVWAEIKDVSVVEATTTSYVVYFTTDMPIKCKVRWWPINEDPSLAGATGSAAEVSARSGPRGVALSMVSNQYHAGKTFGFEISRVDPAPPDLRPYTGTFQFLHQRPVGNTEFFGFSVSPAVLNYTWARYDPNQGGSATQTPSMVTTAIPPSIRDVTIQHDRINPEDMLFTWTTDRACTHTLRIFPEPYPGKASDSDPAMGSGKTIVYTDATLTERHSVLFNVDVASRDRSFRYEITGKDDLNRDLRPYTGAFVTGTDISAYNIGTPVGPGWETYGWRRYANPEDRYPNGEFHSTYVLTTSAVSSVQRKEGRVLVTGAATLPAGSLIRVVVRYKRSAVGRGNLATNQNMEFASAQRVMGPTDSYTFRVIGLEPNTAYQVRTHTRTPDGQDWLGDPLDMITLP